MRTILLALVSFPVLMLTAQPEQASFWQLQESPEGTHTILAKGVEDFGSNSLTSDLALAFRYKYNISRQSIQNNLDRLNSNNITGNTSLHELIYANQKPDHKFHYATFLTNTIYNGFLYPGDLFRLIFEGNKSQAGKEISLAPIQHTYYQYQQVGFSWLKSGLFNNDAFDLGLGISLVKGTRQVQTKISSGTFFTSAIGDSLYAEVSIKNKNTLHSRQQLWHFNGWGGALHTYLSFSPSQEDHSFFLSLRDLGMIYWTQSTRQFRIDTFLSFTGLDVFNPQSSLRFNFQQDSLIRDFNSSYNEEPYLTKLPARIILIYSFNSGAIVKGSRLTAGIKYLWLSNYFPVFSLEAGKKLGTHTQVTLGGHYGGFGSWGLRLQGKFRILQKLQLNAGTNHLEGLFFPGKSSNQGIYISAGYSF